MRIIGRTVLRALMMLMAWASVGLGVNLVSPDAVPLAYMPPKMVALSRVKVLLVDEKEARRHYGNSETIFVDSRNREDFDEIHVKGAVYLGPKDVEEHFPAVQAFLPEESGIVLYCYGPECDMAEEVAGFLAQMGYKNLMIMSAGFYVWKRAGYPVSKGSSAD